MAWYRCGGGGLPAGLQSDMDTVLNKKFSTSTTYPPTDWPDTVNLMGPLPEKTASGAIANITDGADGVPLKNWLVTLPASLDGYTEVNGYKQGANVIDYASNLTSGTSGGLTFSVTADGGISYSGTASSTFAYMTAKFDFDIKSGQTFTFSRNTAFSYIHRITLTFSDDTTANVSIPANDTSVTYTPAKDVKAVRLLVAGLTTNTSYNDTVYLQTEYGSTPTAYEAYEAPTQYTASLGRTIYGGQADIVTGEGVDYGLWVNMSDIAWTEDPNRPGVFYGTVTGRKTATADDPSPVIGCTCYDVNNVNVTTGIDKYISGARSYGGTIIFFRDSAFAGYTRAQVQEALQDEKVCVISATPTNFTFTPITAETALGVNNFWADEGDSDVTYRADISLALQALGGGGRGLMMMRPTEPEETEETEETEGLEDELNR